MNKAEHTIKRYEIMIELAAKQAYEAMLTELILQSKEMKEEEFIKAKKQEWLDEANKLNLTASG